MPSSFSNRARQAVRVLALCSVAWVIWTVFRSRQLLANTRQLASQSQKFPREYFVGNPQSPLFIYYVLGDSTAFGCGAPQLSDTYPYQVAQVIAACGYYVRVLNISAIGDTLRDVRERQLPFLRAPDPDLITVSIGANDATHFTSPDSFAQDLYFVLAKLEASDTKHILFANTPDMYLAPALPLPLSKVMGRRAQRQNEILVWALKRTSVVMVDLYGRGKLDYHRDKSLYTSDLFHPSAKGYRVWAKLFIRELSRL